MQAQRPLLMRPIPHGLFSDTFSMRSCTVNRMHRLATPHGLSKQKWSFRRCLPSHYAARQPFLGEGRDKSGYQDKQRKQTVSHKQSGSFLAARRYAPAEPEQVVRANVPTTTDTTRNCCRVEKENNHDFVHAKRQYPHEPFRLPGRTSPEPWQHLRQPADSVDLVDSRSPARLEVTSHIVTRDMRSAAKQA